ncbi:hypothetical protein QYF36_001055 [Acer negundo]|nr:hypothetical protein QYF36_001055 [Acer negundo]
MRWAMGYRQLWLMALLIKQTESDLTARKAKRFSQSQAGPILYSTPSVGAILYCSYNRGQNTSMRQTFQNTTTKPVAAVAVSEVCDQLHL